MNPIKGFIYIAWTYVRLDLIVAEEERCDMALQGR
jgi:hypothetical protein